MQTPSSPKRIEYIDALRGFTMILVVFSRVELFSLNIHPENSLLNSVFITFRMPLFFFISGFIAYKAGKIWDGKAWITNTKKKLLVQLIPTLVFGSLCSYASGHNIFAWINTPSKFGYWFTLALLNMFLIYYTFNYLTCKLNANSKGGGIALYGVALILYLSTYIFGRLPASAKAVTDLFTLYNTFFYFQFFVFGNLFARFMPFFEKLLTDSRFTAGIIISFCFFFWLNSTAYLDKEGILAQHSMLLRSGINQISFLLPKYCALLIVFALFRKHKQLFSSTTRLGTYLQYIGKRTLDVYLLHYFFLQSIPWIGDFFKSSPNMVLELTTGISLSILIIIICLTVSNILRISDLLGHYLFGAKIPVKQ